MSNLENGAAAPQQVQLTVSGILADLENGLTRAMIQGKYNLTGKDLSELFKHPKLKGKKTKAAPRFTLIDDTAEETIQAVEEMIEVEDVVEAVDSQQEVLVSEDDSWEEDNLDESSSLV